MKYHYELKLHDIATEETTLYKMCFTGKARKFVTLEQAENAKNNLLKQICRSGKTVEEELKRCYQTVDIEELVPKKRQSKVADPTFVNPYKAGDILCGTYGYSMTLPIFFEVVKVTKAQVVLKELKTYVSSGDYMQGSTMPCLGEYASEQTYRCGVNKSSWGYGVSVHGKYVCTWSGKAIGHDRMD